MVVVIFHKHYYLCFLQFVEPGILSFVLAHCYANKGTGWSAHLKAEQNELTHYRRFQGVDILSIERQAAYGHAIENCAGAVFGTPSLLIGNVREAKMKLINRLTAGGLALLFASFLVTSFAAAAEVNDDGLHVQPWFHDSFLEFQDDLAEAREAGKDLIILIEQKGCPYCLEMHEKNFTREDIVKTITEGFVVIQLNMWGAREVVDFDGETLTENKLMRKWGVSFTPTSLFFAWDDKENKPTNMRDALAFRMPGYFKPFHHISGLEYVSSDGYKEQPSFQRWLQAKADKMREDGKEVKIWE